VLALNNHGISYSEINFLRCNLKRHGANNIPENILFWLSKTWRNERISFWAMRNNAGGCRQAWCRLLLGGCGGHSIAPKTASANAKVRNR